jgi:hypothetical protein
MRRINGSSANRILKWLRSNNYSSSLTKLELKAPQKRQHSHSVWHKDFSAIDLWSPRFIRQKLNYIHNNPVRAGLCDHPAKWRWSSYHAYLPHEAGSVPIEVDWRAYWNEESGEEESAPGLRSSISGGGQSPPGNDGVGVRDGVENSISCGGQSSPGNDGS